MKRRFKCPYCDAEFPPLYRWANGKVRAGWRVLYDHVMHEHQEATDMTWTCWAEAEDAADAILRDVWELGSNQGFWTEPDRR